MQNFINTITPMEWGLLGIAVLALLFSIMAWSRAGRALNLANKPTVIATPKEEPIQKDENRPAVSLEITANKNEFDQVSLEVSNTGLLAARKVNIIIDQPEHIYDAESLNEGIEVANVSGNSVIIPRLAVLDEDNKFPIKEIPSGKSIELPAALTMSHGKICDFPVSLSWKDEHGANQNMQVVLTV